jgi:hypothetical protein
MRLRPTPPAVPQELIDRFGQPEDTFGPNARFRVVAGVCGLAVLAVAVVFYALALGAGGGGLRQGDSANGLAAIGLTAVAGLLLAMMWAAPRNWVFVCPGGVVRTRGATWDGLGWAEVKRFEDATLGHQGVTIRQCRLMRKDGSEWGFLADHLAEYHRLREVLSRKVGEGESVPGSREPKTE